MCAALSGTNDKPNLIGQNKRHSIECRLPYMENYSNDMKALEFTL